LICFEDAVANAEAGATATPSDWDCNYDVEWLQYTRPVSEIARAAGAVDLGRLSSVVVLSERLQ